MVKAGSRIIKLIASAAMVLALSGCLYPKDQKGENQGSIAESILLVQNAVDTFKQRTGVLPIKNSEMTTPIYEKYVLDMRKLKEGHYLSQIPGTAYENGGTAIFVLVDPENKPTVRVMDLFAYQLTGEVQKKVDDYKSSHQDQLPSGPVVSPHFYQLDFGKLGQKIEQVESRYSRQYLSFVLHDSGTVAIDYGPEIMKMITEKSLASNLDSTTDLRSVLAREAPYVPAKSYPYYWKQGQPVLSEK